MTRQTRNPNPPTTLRALLADSSVYGSLGVLSRMIGVLLIPVIVRVLTVEQYALVDGLTIMYEVILAVALLGLNQGAGRLIAEEDDQDRKRQIVGQALALSLAVSALLTVPLILLSAPLLRGLFGVADGELVLACRLALAGVPCAVVLAFARMLLKWHFRRRAYIALALLETAAIVILTLLAVWQLGDNVAGLFAARFAGLTLSAALACFLCRRYVGVPRGLSWLPSLLSFGSPLMAAGFLHQAIPACERILITQLLGLNALGFYAVGQRFAKLITLLTSGFELAWTPFAYSIYRESHAAATYNRALLGYCALAGSACVLFVAVAKPALIVFASEKYLPALHVLVPLIFAYFIDSVCSITGLGVALAKRTYLSAICYVVNVLVLVVAAVCLARPHGIVGIAYAFLIGKLSRTLLESFLGRLVYPLHFRVRFPAQLVLAAFGVALLIQYLW